MTSAVFARREQSAAPRVVSSDDESEPTGFLAGVERIVEPR
jgi:hypothetical protein